MLIIGLTGSIGMGKSTAAERFRANGVAVFDADAAVHELYAGPAAPLVEAAFPGTTRDGVVNRAALSRVVTGDPAALARLEAIVHPLVRAAERDFLAEQKARGARFAVLEIPLLYETGAEALVDVVVVVSASGATQRRRVIERPGMTEEKLASLLARQTSDAEKRRRADFVVDTEGPREQSAAAIDAILAALVGRCGQAYHRMWAPGLQSSRS
ncbi:MAG: dephospho-CoA kinase [Pseudomonadota bacterium]